MKQRPGIDLALAIAASTVMLMSSMVYAISASPLSFETVQPDGRPVRLHIRGDEWFNWHEDLNGYTVVRDNAGRYAYAQLGPDNRLVPTPLTVGIDNPRAHGLSKRILPPQAVRQSMRPQLIDGESDATAPQAVSPSGTVRNLVILCKFSDHVEGVDTRPAADYDVLFNQIGGDPSLAPTGSVKDLYLENSYGQMTLDSTVVGWVTLPNTEAYYADGEDGLGLYPSNAQKMVMDALDLVDPLVDFSQFDNDHDGNIDAIDIIHSGYGAETGGGGGDWIWSHRWSVPFPYWTSDEGVRVSDYHTEPALWGTSGANIVRFGVIAHETGHFFGLPDLYDTDQSGEGIGSWGLMANSWGFDNSQLHPPHFCAWSKIDLGWITPTIISMPGLYTIDQYQTNPQVYRIDLNYPSDEYLLLENRQPAGIESVIPQGGLCIFHIDDTTGYYTEGYPGQTGWPENGNHYRVAVLQADGTYDLEKNFDRGDRYDVYHAAGISEIGPGPGNYPNTDAYQDGIIIDTGNRIHSVSASGSTMSFVFGELIDPTPPSAYDVNVMTDLNMPVTITLNGTDDGLPNTPGGLSYLITSLPNHGILSETATPATPIDAVPYLLAGSQVVYTPRPGCDASAAFRYLVNDGGVAPSGGDSNEATVAVGFIMTGTIYSAPMYIDPDWIYEGSWEWGIPSEDTATDAVGYNLSGDYAKNMTTTEYATTPVFDCSGFTDTTLTFKRWLTVEDYSNDRAVIDISLNGTDWMRLWQNDQKVMDSGWTDQVIDISAYADDQSAVYLRWGMGPTNKNRQYSGWNIDDVLIIGQIQPLPPILGDMEPDCDVDSDDLKRLMDYWLATCGPCDGADLVADGIVNLPDLAALAQNWLTGL